MQGFRPKICSEFMWYAGRDAGQTFGTRDENSGHGTRDAGQNSGQTIIL